MKNKKKICVEIEFTRIIEKDIEIPEGYSVDDVMGCSVSPKGKSVSITFPGGKGNTNPTHTIDMDYKDFSERCHFHNETSILDLDTNKRTRFR